ncbi:glomulin-like [Cotesia glomerata]|uniref:glomulin-like n=1 Tax=Cotesia glomerata TaxID=32391 RepID=UPI001D02D5FD|nr:glomulin-like [Cotesia glomerata]
MDENDENSVVNNSVKQIRKFLNKKKCQEAIGHLLEISKSEVLDQCSWKLVPAVVELLNEDNYLNNRDVFNTCEKILEIVADNCNANETVLLFLEQVEDLENDIRFRGLLKPLAKSLDKANLDKVIEWVISTIVAYCENLPSPDNVKLEETNDDGFKEDKDPVSERLTSTYQSILSFSEHVINRVISLKSNHIKLSMQLLNLYLSLFGKSFSNLNINKGETYCMFESSIIQMSRLTGDLLKFLKFIEERNNEQITKNIEERKIDLDNIQSLENQLFQVEINDLAYANFYFILMTSEKLNYLIPKVYHPHYLMNILFYLGNCLLIQPEYILVSKGLKLIDNTLKKIDIESISYKSTELTIHHDLLSSLSQIMIFCDSVPERKMALNIFRQYIKLFSMKRRYLLIIHLYETSKNSGLRSLIISILKELIITSLDTKLPCEYFIGDKLAAILLRICKLPNESKSDLVEISDEIITTLNLLRFLILRDKNNITNIWTVLKSIEINYLEPLRKGIELSRAHWEMKIRDLENEKKMLGNQKDEILTDINVMVGGENLPKMPVEETIKFCTRSLWTSRLLLASHLPIVEGSKKDGFKFESEEEYEKNIKIKILSASLPFVNEFGWSRQTISAGAEALGYPGVAHGMFPKGGIELIQYFYANCNAELNKILKSEALAIEENPAKKKKPPEVFVKEALEKRLKMMIPYKSTWPQAITLMTLPPNVPNALANILTLIDDICYYAGDRSVDFNWYTRRIVLAGIYKTTELFLLQDSSENNQRTWEFLERRIQDAYQIYSLLNVASDLPPPDRVINRATEATTAVFVTARNILGLNWNR